MWRLFVEVVHIGLISIGVLAIAATLGLLLVRRMR